MVAAPNVFKRINGRVTLRRDSSWRTSRKVDPQKYWKMYIHNYSMSTEGQTHKNRISLPEVLWENKPRRPHFNFKNSLTLL